MANLHGEFSVIFPFSSGLPRDISVNTFHVLLPDGVNQEDGFEAARERIIDFYNGENTGRRLAEYISQFAQGTDTIMEFRLWTGSTSVLLNEIEFDANGAPATQGVLPTQVSAVVSWHGGALAYSGETTPVRNRRGKTYLGPLNASAQLGPVSVPSTLPTTFVNDMVEAGERLIAPQWDGFELQLDGPIFCVFSRTRQLTMSMEDSMLPITGGHVDNRYDIQRRRATDPTARSSWNNRE